jgi:hypothetical protein
MRSRNSNDLLSPDSVRERKMSTAGSILSSDYASSAGGEDDDVLKCDNCRCSNFRSVKGRDGRQKLICSQCHRPVN